MRDLLFSVAATASFVVSISAFFFLGARVLDVEDFAGLSQAYALASLFALLISYGYPQRLLQSIPRSISKSHPDDLLFTQLVLFALVSPIAGVAAWLFGFDLLLCVLQWGGAVSIAIANTFQTVFRANGRHRSDAILRSSSRLLLGVLIIGVALLPNPSATGFALAFFVSGLVELIASLALIKAQFGLSMTFRPLKEIAFDLWRDIAYMVDLVVQRAFGTLDILIIGAFSTPDQVAIYTVGQKIAQLSLSMLQPLMNTQVPRMAEAVHAGQDAFREAFRANARLSLLAGLAGAVVTLMFSCLPLLGLLGPTYGSANAVIAIFAIAVALRFLAASMGLALLAQGRQTARLIANATSVGLLLVVGPIFSLTAGAKGMVFSVVIMSVVLLGIFRWQIRSRPRDKVPADHN